MSRTRSQSSLPEPGTGAESSSQLAGGAKRASSAFPVRHRRTILLVAIAIALPALLESNFTPPLDFPWASWQTAINLALIASIVAVSLNVLTGYGGQASVAHVGFLILGAIVAAHFGQRVGVPFLLVLPLAWIIGSGVGVVIGIPALRIRGLYLFMATLGVHFIAVFIFQMYQIGAWGVSGVFFAPPSVQWLARVPGLAADPGDASFLIIGFTRWYWTLLIVATICITLMRNLMRFHFGRASIAVRENYVAASMLGVDVRRTTLTAFAVTSGFICVAGVLFSHYIGALTEEAWTLGLLIDYVMMIIIGGLGTILGGVFGAFFFYGASILLDWMLATPVFDDIAFVRENSHAISRGLYGAAVVAILLFKPTGLVAIWQGLRSSIRRTPTSTHRTPS